MAKSVVVSGGERPGAQQNGLVNQVTGFFTRSRDFLKDVRGEMSKVVTPSRAEVQATTTVVIVAVFSFAAFFYVVDGILGYALQRLLHMLGGTQ
jgi:preprotein translocase subunit SecE